MFGAAPCSRVATGSAYHHQLHGDLDQGDAKLNELTHWYVSSKCVFHLVHGSLKSSVIDYSEYKMLMKKCWVTLEALPSSYGQLLKNAATWVDARLYFEDWDMPCQAGLWRTLGIEPEVAERFVDLQLRWDPAAGKLKVGVRHVNDPSISSEIVSLLCTTSRFRSFSDSRWISLGGTARKLVVATMLGIENLVSWIMAAAGESKHFISGFSQYDARAKEFMSITGIASYLPDCILGLLMDDDRLPVVIDRFGRLGNRGRIVGGRGGPLRSLAGDIGRHGFLQRLQPSRPMRLVLPRECGVHLPGASLCPATSIESVHR